jgi:tRNA threonylcarbamoyl adenosine modification protein (Sua5/YciO/YrdC/YwlC family)
MRVISTADENWLHEALAHLGRGLVVALPTETVYGVAALLRPDAVERIYTLKGRAADKALPLQTDSLERAVGWGFRLSPGACRLAAGLWPGPLTLLLGRPANCPSWFAPGAGLIALRIPYHPVVAALLAAAGEPLAVTSANLSGEAECLDGAAVARAFASEEDLLIVDGGPSPGGAASTVVDASGSEPKIVREGPILRTMIEEVWHGA